MKKILFIHYSQTGQLSQILQQVKIGLSQEVEEIQVEMKNEFAFPWSGKRFFHAMPESVLEIGQEINPIDFKETKYDLIVFGYQPWYLSPSIPTTSILDDPEFQKRVKDTPVVTVIGARNMWLNSQEVIKKRIKSYGGDLIGNIPFCDKNNNFLSAISILHWMLNGKKEKLFGIFPKPGVMENDIQRGSEIGNILKRWSENEKGIEVQKEINERGIYSIGTNIMFIESRAKKLFEIWAKLILSKGKTEKSRQFYETLFKYYLIVALFLVAPIVLSLYTILIRPFTAARIKKKKHYFYGVKS